ncbi:MAG: amino acid ABC transporter substrate-binding protein [Paraglaciecola sp.]|nr:amino acid ABC transporter substrate-binding protein [Paraglaciecola sp.]NCT46494.1 amino acid ABC transporter substrate-binding protein [Paraglaciecola sp.]
MAIWVLIVTLSGALTAQAEDKFIFGVNAPGSPPYLYMSDGNPNYQGLINDVLEQLGRTKNLSIEYVDSFRVRTEKFLYDGKIDAFLTSERWLSHPEKLIHSLPIALHRTFLYAMTPFPPDFDLTRLSRILMCTRRGYLYPSVQAFFDNKQFHRIDSDSQLSMMNMLKIKRCDFAIMHEYNANTILASQAFADVTIYHSAQPVDVTDLSIFLRPELVEIKMALDQIIANMQASGELAASLQRHIDEGL